MKREVYSVTFSPFSAPYEIHVSLFFFMTPIFSEIAKDPQYDLKQQKRTFD